MIQVFKIMSGLDRIEPGLFFHQPVHAGTRGHSQKIHKKRFRLDVRGSFFSQRIVGDWNSLPENVIMSDTLNCFKSRLDRLWRHKQYKIPWFTDKLYITVKTGNNSHSWLHIPYIYMVYQGMRKWSFGGLEPTIVAWRETTQYWTRGDDEGQFVYLMRSFLVIYINLDMYVIKSMSYICYLYILFYV